eukprot:2552506-Pleurochrysis_carterae.AAC.2
MFFTDILIACFTLGTSGLRITLAGMTETKAPVATPSLVSIVAAPTVLAATNATSTEAAVVTSFMLVYFR